MTEPHTLHTGTLMLALLIGFGAGIALMLVAITGAVLETRAERRQLRMEEPGAVLSRLGRTSKGV